MVVAVAGTLHVGPGVNAYDLFWKDGYLPIGRVSASAEADDLKVELGRMLARREIPEDHLMRAPTDRHVRVALHLCHLNPRFRHQAVNGPSLAVIRDLFGENLVVLTSLVFNKPPQIGLPLAFHQDLPYYPYLRDNDLITCWTALDNVDGDNGGVEYLPGSHRVRVPHRASGEQQALDVDPALIDSPALVGVSLKAGEAVLHHGLTVHRSSANTSDRPRAGLATLYIRASAVVDSVDFPYGVLQTGETHADS